MNIEEIKQKYKDEWVLGEVKRSDELNRPVDVEVIMHSKNRDDVYDALEKIKDKKHLCTFYTGKIPEKGYAVAFYGKG